VTFMMARWVTGFIAGVLAVPALLVVVPPSGLVLIVVVALLLLVIKARGLLALLGMLCGAGVSGVGLFAQTNARCETSYAGCHAMKVTDPVVIFVALLLLGAAITLVHYVQGRADRVTA
jgi:hypothetical protein